MHLWCTLMYGILCYLNESAVLLLDDARIFLVCCWELSLKTAERLAFFPVVQQFGQVVGPPPFNPKAEGELYRQFCVARILS
jgi:hypothetical protein